MGRMSRQLWCRLPACTDPKARIAPLPLPQTMGTPQPRAPCPRHTPVVRRAPSRLSIRHERHTHTYPASAPSPLPHLRLRPRHPPHRPALSRMRSGSGRHTLRSIRLFIYAKPPHSNQPARGRAPRMHCHGPEDFCSRTRPRRRGTGDQPHGQNVGEHSRRPSPCQRWRHPRIWTRRSCRLPGFLLARGHTSPHHGRWIVDTL